MGLNRIGLATSVAILTKNSVQTLMVNQNTSIPKDIYVIWLTQQGGERKWIYSIEAWGIKKGTAENVSLGSGWTGEAGHMLEPFTEADGYRYALPLKEALAKCGIAAVDMVGWYTTQYDQIHVGITIKPADYEPAKTTAQFNICYYPVPTSAEIGTVDASRLGLALSVPTQWTNPNLDVRLYSLVDADGRQVCPQTSGGINLDSRFSSGSIMCYVPVSSLLFPPSLPNGGTCTAVVSISAPGSAPSLTKSTVQASCKDMNLGSITATASRNAATGAVTITANAESSLSVNQWSFGIVGSTIASDNISTPDNHATFVVAPSNAFDVSVRATNDRYNAVATTTVNVPAWNAGHGIGNVFSICRSDGSVPAVVGKYNVSVDESGQPDTQRYRLAGRKRPAAFYGEGGTKAYTVGWDIPPDDAVPGAEATMPQLARLRQMADGDCVADLPTGERIQVSCGHPSVSRSSASRITHVSVTIEEVS